MRLPLALVLVAGMVLTGSARAQAPPAERSDEPTAAAPINIPLPTLGGEQFWSDELVIRGWRIQQNVLSGHYRLLDADDVRRAWGTRQHCQAALDDVKRQGLLEPLDGAAVITLHGLGRSRDHMEGLGRYIAQQTGLHWENVSYASTRRSLDEHAASLASVLAGLEGIDEISFVCHSLGNLVVRRYLGEALQPQPRWQPDPRIKRMVMLGPPNQGAQFAGLFKNNDLYGLLTGPSGKQLARQWEETAKLLATPAFPFGILAGGRGDTHGLNPLVDGDDDLVVSVEETYLAGAADFRRVDCLHGRMMQSPEVREYVVRFLERGYFTTEAERQPLADLPPATVRASLP